MSTELLRALLLSDAATPEGLARALFSSLTEDRSILRTLVVTGAVDERRLQDELARWEGPQIRNVVPVLELCDRLPEGLCRRLVALPIRLDPRTGTVDVAVADGRDGHAAREIGRCLGAPVRAVRAKLTTLLAALQKLEAQDRSRAPAAAATPAAAETPAPLYAPAPLDRAALVPRETPLWGTPIVAVDGPRKKDSSPPSVEMPIPLLRRPSLEPPDTTREPEPTFDLVPSQRLKPPALPLPEIEPVLTSLRAAADRDSVLSILLSGVRGVARRAAILVVKHDTFVGWSCTPELGSAGALRNVRIPVGVPSALATAAAKGLALGPLPDTDAHRPLLAVMGRTSPDVAICPVRLGGKTALLVVADELADPALSTKHMEAIAAAASQALARLVRHKAG